MSEKKLTINLSASLFKHSGCLRRLEYITQHELVEIKAAQNTAFGTAFHLYRAILRKTGDNFSAMKSAIESFTPQKNDWRDLQYLSMTMLSYYEKVYLRDVLNPLTFNGGVLVEETFAYKYYESDNLLVNMCGTIDEVAMENTNKNSIVVVDCKTTSSYNIEQYLFQYYLAPQMLFYVMVMHDVMKIPKPGVVIDGVFIAKNRPAIFKRTPIIRYTEEQIANFKHQLDDLVQQLEQVATSGNWKQDLRYCAPSGHVSCPYFRLCAESDEELRNIYLESSFKQRNNISNKLNYIDLDEQ